MDEETTPAVVIRAKSNVKHLVPGYKFTLQRHFNADGDVRADVGEARGDVRGGVPVGEGRAR